MSANLDWQDDDVITTDFRSLKQGMREAAQAEQERITKLLEDDQWHQVVIRMTDPPKRAHSYDCVGCRQIALIKGEQK